MMTEIVIDARGNEESDDNGGGTNKNFCGNGDNNDGDHELEGCSLAKMMLVIIFMEVTLRAKFANIVLMTWSMVVVIVMIGKMLMMMMTV